MDDVTFLFNDWAPVARVLFITVTGYLTLLVLLRVNGQRTLAQMSALDMIITVTIGSAFGRVITAREVALVEVVAAFVALVLIERLVAEMWSRTGRLRGLLRVRPALLYYDGQVLNDAMRRHRLVESDLLTIARHEGMGSLEDAQAIVMEANGEFSVLAASQFGDGSALQQFRDGGSLEQFGDTES